MHMYFSSYFHKMAAISHFGDLFLPNLGVYIGCVQYRFYMSIIIVTGLYTRQIPYIHAIFLTYTPDSLYTRHIPYIHARFLIYTPDSLYTRQIPYIHARFTWRAYMEQNIHEVSRDWRVYSLFLFLNILCSRLQNVTSFSMTLFADLIALTPH